MSAEIWTILGSSSAIFLFFFRELKEMRKEMKDGLEKVATKMTDLDKRIAIMEFHTGIKAYREFMEKREKENKN